MANRKELIEAMRVLKNHCKTIGVEQLEKHQCCNEVCPIGKECELFIESDALPEDWNLEESETE